MLPYLSIGPAVVPVPALLLLAGVWVGTGLAEGAALRLGLNRETLANLILYSLIGGIVGARLGHVLRHPAAYLADPLGVIALTPSTLWVDAGWAAAVITAVVYGQRRALPLRLTLDALATGAAAFLVAVGLAHVASGDAFGAPTELPWAITQWDARRHPTQVYETILALVILAIIWRRPLGDTVPGLNAVLFVALTAAARLFLDAFRGDSVLWAGGVRAAQVMALAVLAAALALLRAWALNSGDTHHDRLPRQR